MTRLKFDHHEQRLTPFLLCIGSKWKKDGSVAVKVEPASVDTSAGTPTFAPDPKWRGDPTASKWVPQDHLLPLDTAKVDDMKSEYFSKHLQVSCHPWRHVHVSHPRNGGTRVHPSHETRQIECHLQFWIFATPSPQVMPSAVSNCGQTSNKTRHIIMCSRLPFAWDHCC